MEAARDEARQVPIMYEMGKRYKGIWTSSMLANYCLYLQHKAANIK